jgi:hypothetical protein
LIATPPGALSTAVLDLSEDGDSASGARASTMVRVISSGISSLTSAWAHRTRDMVIKKLGLKKLVLAPDTLSGLA